MPSTLPELASLKYLHFSGNGISQLPENIMALNNLQVLSIHSKNFVLSEHIKELRQMPSLREVQLNGDYVYKLNGNPVYTPARGMNEIRLVPASNGYRNDGIAVPGIHF
ncbi:MAG: hypothetical protein KF687_16410 [Cyclobacteriaceae bacterium]|nr:hypothetical protein [Cyclobacteriaceae bacterium]